MFFVLDSCCPPLMFSEDEIEALVLGSRWVADRADAQLSEAARNVIAKIAAILPADLRLGLEISVLLVGPEEPIATGDKELAQIRLAIRSERKLEIHYRDLKEKKSTRTIWPFAVGFFERVRVVVGWCELRQEFRHFRIDRIIELTLSEQRYPRRRHAMFKAWREVEGILDKSF